MPKLHLLGTGAAVAEPHRTTTMLALSNAEGIVAVDCGGDFIHRMLAAGLSPDQLNALILTHEHADHTGGFPLFMEKIWLHGRRKSLPVYGPESALDQTRKIFSTFDTSLWEGLPAIIWSPVEMEPGSQVFEDWGWTVTSSPGDHGVTVLGFRFEDKTSGSVATYSSDTAPCTEIVDLARNSDLLVHEATGPSKGHTSPIQAAEIALAAQVKRLLLVHLSPESMSGLKEARPIFPQTDFGLEMGEYAF